MKQDTQPEERTVRFLTLEEADREDRAYYASLTPEERLEIQAELIWRHHGPPSRLERILTFAELEEC